MVKSATWSALYAAVRAAMPSAFEAEQLFAHVTGLHGYDLPARGAQAVPPAQAKLLADLCRRRQSGEPLQYLLGEWEFYGLPFSVGEGVLIPRGDTETLVDAALAMLPAGRPVVLDLCSGSGAVAVAVAHSRPGAQVSALELSPTALRYLRENVARNEVCVEVIAGDLFRYVPPRPLHLITANPPYIRTAELAELQVEVHSEPVIALDGGADGLDFYREIAGRYPAYLLPGGAVCLETGFDQSQAVAALLEEAGLQQVRIHPDLAGIPRVVCGVKT